MIIICVHMLYTEVLNVYTQSYIHIHSLLCLPICIIAYMVSIATIRS